MSSAAESIPAAIPTTVPDAAERTRALDVDTSFIVEAPAGSGKTGLLIQRLLKLLCRVQRPESVLALTFTRKATAEMRERVLQSLDLVDCEPAGLTDFERTTRQLAEALLHHDRKLGWDLRANSFRLNIRTIDSLCGEIARSLPVSSGSVGHMGPVDDAGRLYREAARAVMLRLGGDDSVLNQAIRTVLLRRDGELRNCEDLLTQMLATREQWGRIIPFSQEQLTEVYLNQTVKPRLDRALTGIVCDTLSRLEQAFPPRELHALTELAVLLARADGHDGAPNPIAGCAARNRPPGSEAVDADHWAMLAHLLVLKEGWRKSKGVTDKNLNIVLDSRKAELKVLLEALSHRDDLHRLLCDVRNLPPAAMPEEDWKVTKALFHLLHSAFRELREVFRRRNECDFVELLLSAKAALDRPDTGGNAVTGVDIEHLLVDEMQDTSTAQYELIEALTRGWDGAARTVFLVGDPKQSIYLFRQARVDNFLASLRNGRLGSVPLTVLRLSTNFRSTPPLVEEFNRLFAPIFAQGGNGAIGYVPATAGQARGVGSLRWQVQPVGGEHGQASRRLSRTAIRREMSEHIVHTIHALREKPDAGQTLSMAVLVRTREHAAPVTRLLQQAGIPFRGVDLESLAERPEVLDTLALTRSLLHPADRVAWLAVLRAPWCGATLQDLHHLAAGAEPGSHNRAPRKTFRDAAATLPEAARARILRCLDVLDAATENLGRFPLSELVERTGRALGADRYRDDEEQENVRRFLELLEALEAELQPIEAATVEARLSRLFAGARTTPGAVEIMTIHKAKGLEWDVVFVPDLQRKARKGQSPLLDWLELPGNGAHGTSVLLSPIAPRRSRTAELGCYVQAARDRQEHAEVARLLYVVATRARRDLFLYAAPALRKAERTVIHDTGTLLHAAWPGAGAMVQQKCTDADTDAVQVISSLKAEADDSGRFVDLSDLRRVPDGFHAELPRAPLRLAWLQAAAEHPAAMEDVDRREGTLASRAVGNTVHSFLDLLAQRIAADPARATADRLFLSIGEWSDRVRAVLRGSGVHGRNLEQGTASVLQMLRQTVQCDTGLWLLQPHPGARSEQALAAGDDDEAVAVLRLDRSFLAGPDVGSTGKDTLWIVDYKIAAPGSMAEADFLRSERERYGPQLRNYARFRSMHPDSPARIMLGLFYPAIAVLDSWPWQP